MKENGQWVPCVRNSYSFMPIHLKLYMCYGHGMKICMWFGYNPWIIFVIFFHNLNLVIVRCVKLAVSCKMLIQLLISSDSLAVIT